ncbi:MAG: hypothetical protein ACLFTH_04340 [Candidatus Woesearchaeota archaeon]
MDEKSPVFIKIDEYRKVLDLVDDLKKKTGEVRSTINEIKELRDKEEETLQFWQQKIDDVDKKILFVDQTLFEPES